MLYAPTLDATKGDSPEKGLIFFARLMSDYEVTLVNDNSTIWQKRPIQSTRG